MPRHKDTYLAGGVTLAVVVVLAIGFHELTPRATERAIRADGQRVTDLQSIAQVIYARQKAPASLNELSNARLMRLNDPVSHTPYEYHLQSGTQYQLCATFSTETPAPQAYQPPGPSFWIHRAGRQCFELDASRMPGY